MHICIYLLYLEMAERFPAFDHENVYRKTSEIYVRVRVRVKLLVLGIPARATSKADNRHVRLRKVDT